MTTMDAVLVGFIAGVFVKQAVKFFLKRAARVAAIEAGQLRDAARRHEPRPS